MTAACVWNASNAAGGAGGGPEVSANTSHISNFSSFSTVYANLQYNSNGTEYTNSSATVDNTSTSRGTWLDSGLNSEVWVERTINSGALYVDPGAGRLVLSTSRTYKERDINSFPASQITNMTMTFYDAASGGNTLQTFTMILTADYNSDGGGCTLCCFTPDTLITMANGTLLPIADIREGDMIKTKTAPDRVTQIITAVDRDMFTLTFDDGSTINTSDDHPFDVGGYPKSLNPVHPYKDLGIPRKLKLGDIVTGEDGFGRELIKIKRLDYPGLVYTLRNPRFYANGFMVY